ncbi:MAG: response regulator [bacterium]|nr:response regulator [bacterium]
MKHYENNTILIVDDEPEALQEIADSFLKMEMPYTIIRAPNGNVALEILKNRAIDLVITDWDMPCMNGIELVKNIRKNDSTKEIPAIMCTGVMTTSENLITAMEAGASDYIRKPVDILELVARTNSMLKLSDSFKEIKEKNRELEKALGEISILRGILPICAKCKKVRDDHGYWNQIEKYISERSEAEFSHGLCPGCTEELYGDEEWYKRNR